jgi:DNA-binding response OmpR family regulator
MSLTETNTILLADDDEMIVDALRFQLEREGYVVLAAHDGVEALHLARTKMPDLVLLDILMPKKQGWEVCKEIRAESTVPILMLTARGAEMDRVMGLELGADDYIVKPFSFSELLARIRANLRRVQYAGREQEQDADELIEIGFISIDRKRHQVARHGEAVKLSQREYDLLIALQDAEGAVVPRDELLDRVWGEEWIGDPRTLDVHIRWCRQKLEDHPNRPRLIHTVRGVGYRLVSADELERGN